MSAPADGPVEDSDVSYTSEQETAEILADPELVASILRSRAEAAEGLTFPLTR